MTVADISKVDAGDGAGPRNIEMRFTMREMLTLHDALQRRHEALSKDAWWLDGKGDPEKASSLREQAAEHHDLAERLFDHLRGMMGTKR